ncbi:UDP-glucuronosyltransferase [Aphelenchoides fujianensis]|nr:UDP-glucuronosyltransferase [Aphelenchoides fujianensis]
MKTSILIVLLFALVHAVTGMRILQIVPGFTNSHVLFNYRLADTLTAEGHSVKMWTQMEMGMVVAGDLKMPRNVSEVRVPIYFTDTMKSEGLKVFQTMMFQAGSAYDLYWTGQEFKDLRLESCEQMLSVDSNVINDFRRDYFDLAIGHFHDLCPLAMARLVGVKELVWITHGTDRMSLWERTINILWHLSTIDFVNLPQNLLHDENAMYKKFHKATGDEDLWSLSRRVRVLLVNGERFLDFPRPLPPGIGFMGEVKTTPQISAPKLTGEVGEIVERAKHVVIFSLGTVSNTTNMPPHMLHSFLEAFGQFPDHDFLWRMEAEVPNAHKYPNVHLLKWLPQKELMISKVRSAIAEILNNKKYARNAKRLSAMLHDKPSPDPSAMLKYGLKLATLPRDHFTLRAAQKLNFLRFYNLDIISLLIAMPVLFFSLS